MRRRSPACSTGRPGSSAPTSWSTAANATAALGSSSSADSSGHARPRTLASPPATASQSTCSPPASWTSHCTSPDGRPQAGARPRNQAAPVGKRCGYFGLRAWVHGQHRSNRQPGKDSRSRGRPRRGSGCLGAPGRPVSSRGEDCLGRRGQPERGGGREYHRADSCAQRRGPGRRGDRWPSCADAAG